jgi:PrtD family type I secretion system ABC transporter
MAMNWMKVRHQTEVEHALRLCRYSLALVAGLSFFVNLLALTMPLYLLQVYDHVLSSQSLDTLFMLTLIVVFALALHAVIEALRREMLARVGAWLEERLQAPVLTAAVQAALRADPAGAAQAWRDLGTLRQFFGGSACTALFDLPWTPIFLLAMTLVHPVLGAIGIVASLILFGFAWLNETVTRAPFARAAAASSESQHRFESLMRNVEAITAMGMLPGVARILSDEQAHAKAAQLSAGARASAIQASARFVRFLAQVLVMAAASFLVIRHDVSPAAIFAASILLGRSLGPVEGAIGTWKAVTNVRLAYDRIRRIMQAAPPPVKGMELPAPSGLLEVEQLTYVPPGSTEPIVRRLSMMVCAGKVLGVVGPSGAGKSTLGRLIAGTVPPTTGHVRLDGADVGVWMASGGHRYFGYLPQDVELFAGTVAENISRLSEASSSEVIAAARLVDLHDTVMRLPRGYDTHIGEGGARLSGGQRQKLGLARAFFGDPRLIVLDEPNASLDPEGEEALRRAIDEMKSRGATIIVIAQRLGILSVADSVLVLDNGMVNAYGERREIAERIAQGRTAIRVVQQAKSKPDARMPKVNDGPMIAAPGQQADKGAA